MGELRLKHLKITKLIQDVQSDDIIKRLLVQEAKCLVRVYILSAFNLAKRDNDSNSDPYTILKLGKKKYSDRENYIDDESNPDIYRQWEFEALFPGCPELLIQLWDYDMLFGDELIGETRLDLEDRYFSADWKAALDKPVEYRKLSHPSTEIPQGFVKLWAEIIPINDLKNAKTYDISQKPADEYEVRVCIFNSEGLPMMDAEGTTDGFCKAFF